jgi:hypothetical protein
MSVPQKNTLFKKLAAPYRKKMGTYESENGSREMVFVYAADAVAYFSTNAYSPCKIKDELQGMT